MPQIFFQLPNVQVASAYQAIKIALNEYLGLYTLHDLSHSMPQLLQSVKKKQRGYVGYWTSEYMFSIEQ